MKLSASEKHANLVRRLLEHTVDKKIDWELVPFSKQPRALVGGVRIRLSREPGPSEAVWIENPESDEVIDSFTDDDLSGISTDNGRYDTFWDYMTSLRKSAERQASGAEAIVDKLLDDLKELDDPF